MMIYFCTKFVHIHITQNKSIMKNTVLMRSEEHTSELQSQR